MTERKTTTNIQTYEEYLRLRDAGLRKPALKTLQTFLEETKQWTATEKQCFLRCLFSRIESQSEDPFLLFQTTIPQPLREQLVIPSLLTWLQQEKTDPYPAYWYGTYCHNVKFLRKALELDPALEPARIILIRYETDALYDAVHHMPDGLIGDVEELSSIGEEMLQEVELIKDSTLRNHLKTNLMRELTLVRNYADFLRSGHPDLVLWGKENGRIVSRGTRSYDYGCSEHETGR